MCPRDRQHQRVERHQRQHKQHVHITTQRHCYQLIVTSTYPNHLQQSISSCVCIACFNSSEIRMHVYIHSKPSVPAQLLLTHSTAHPSTPYLPATPKHTTKHTGPHTHTHREAWRVISQSYFARNHNVGKTVGPTTEARRSRH